MTPALDASAVLAFIAGEPGADRVREHLDAGAACSAANWSEVAQKVASRGARWDLARALLLSFDLQVEPVTMADAERAAVRWATEPTLSLADRLCLALADRLGGVAVTADTAWGASDSVEQIHAR